MDGIGNPFAIRAAATDIVLKLKPQLRCEKHGEPETHAETNWGWPLDGSIAACERIRMEGVAIGELLAKSAVLGAASCRVCMRWFGLWHPECSLRGIVPQLGDLRVPIQVEAMRLRLDMTSQLLPSLFVGERIHTQALKGRDLSRSYDRALVPKVNTTPKNSKTVVRKMVVISIITITITITITTTTTTSTSTTTTIMIITTTILVVIALLPELPWLSLCRWCRPLSSDGSR